MAKKTVNEILGILVRGISAYRGAAVERAVFGVRGALHVLESIGKISRKKSIEWEKKVMEAGIRQGWDPSQAPVGDLDSKYFDENRQSEQGDPGHRLSTFEFLDMSLLTTRIHDAVMRFSKGGWVDGDEYPARFPELVRLMSTSKHRYHSATIGGVKVTGGTFAGRAMVTFQKGDTQVTVIGSEDEPEKGCGLQSIEASADQAKDMIDQAITGWDILAFHPNPKATIA